ncbi:GNAT family N-acetyltransferase [Peribacillus deserti]|uniref:GNAT family N-acetyltransferase n=1 Tax=Peribacillus deserti TaxID=673318 RepID=A0A2N5M260_9BACI|nr:GNAT family N-acetyltransferase [Peribacillus deserti]PLT28456.1 GNAT family N-acetyltransferase [Peribacillus deserti]
MLDIKKGEHEFYIEKNGEKAAFIQWDSEGKDKNGTKAISIYHTEVGESLKGQGAGKALVEKVVNYAREEKLSVGATCSFAQKVLQETSEFQDVLSEQPKH